MEKKKNRYDGITIIYSNDLARAKNSYSLEEHKALHLIYSHIKPYEKNPSIFQINKRDFFEKLELTGNSKYKTYKKVMNNLRKKSDAKLFDSEKQSEIEGNIIATTEWFKNKSFFEVEISQKFMPYLEQVKNYFTKLDGDSLIRFKSNHSLNLYKFLCSWRQKNAKDLQKELSTRDLKEIFGLTIDDYVINGRFKRWEFEERTLNKALAEINTISDLRVSVTKIKVGIKVKCYKFNWEDLKMKLDSIEKFLNIGINGSKFETTNNIQDVLDFTKKLVSTIYSNENKSSHDILYISLTKEIDSKTPLKKGNNIIKIILSIGNIKVPTSLFLSNVACFEDKKDTGWSLAEEEDNQIVWDK